MTITIKVCCWTWANELWIDFDNFLNFF
jgi:hypothetical protein